MFAQSLYLPPGELVTFAQVNYRITLISDVFDIPPALQVLKNDVDFICDGEFDSNNAMALFSVMGTRTRRICAFHIPSLIRDPAIVLLVRFIRRNRLLWWGGSADKLAMQRALPEVGPCDHFFDLQSLVRKMIENEMVSHKVPLNLAGLCKMVFGVTLNKSLQRANWSRLPSDDMLKYAALDVIVTWRLYANIDTIASRLPPALPNAFTHVVNEAWHDVYQNMLRLPPNATKEISAVVNLLISNNPSLTAYLTAVPSKRAEMASTIKQRLFSMESDELPVWIADMVEEAKGCMPAALKQCISPVFEQEWPGMLDRLWEADAQITAPSTLKGVCNVLVSSCRLMSQTKARFSVQARKEAHKKWVDMTLARILEWDDYEYEYDEDEDDEYDEFVNIPDWVWDLS
jgi:hypothetical protein